MVKLELNLPWKPILAWPWGVRYIVDPDTCLVTDHIESWDIPPLEVSMLGSVAVLGLPAHGWFQHTTALSHVSVPFHFVPGRQANFPPSHYQNY